MRDLDRALADITSIRSHLAAGTMFRGFGPAVIALTGGLAVLTASAQSLWPATFAADSQSFFGCWIVTAFISAALIGAEMLARSRRHHGGLADAMIRNAVQQFVPAGAAGIAIAFVILDRAPGGQWMLPGLWQLLVALGLFASVRCLPYAMTFVAAWYFIAGTGVLLIAAGAAEGAGAGLTAAAGPILSPWLMGAPFAVGQLLMSAVLHFASEEGEGP